MHLLLHNSFVRHFGLYELELFNNLTALQPGKQRGTLTWPSSENKAYIYICKQLLNMERRKSPGTWDPELLTSIYIPTVLLCISSLCTTFVTEQFVRLVVFLWFFFCASRRDYIDHIIDPQQYTAYAPYHLLNNNVLYTLSTKPSFPWLLSTVYTTIICRSLSFCSGKS